MKCWLLAIDRDGAVEMRRGLGREMPRVGKRDWRMQPDRRIPTDIDMHEGKARAVEAAGFSPNRLLFAEWIPLSVILPPEDESVEMVSRTAAAIALGGRAARCPEHDPAGHPGTSGGAHRTP